MTVKYRVVFQHQDMHQAVPLRLGDDLTVGERAANMVKLRRLDRAHAPHQPTNAQLIEASGHRLPAGRSLVEVDTVDSIKKAERVVQLGARLRYQPRPGLRSQHLLKMRLTLALVNPQLAQCDEIVTHTVII